VNDTDFKELPEQEPFWLRLERATACRKRLLAAGYAPLPVNGKEPPLKGWQDIAATNTIIDSWETKYAEAVSTGILTAAVPAIDIDIMHPEAAAAIEALVREHFEERGHILVRFGKAPKRAILLRTDEPFKKIVRKFALPDGSEQRIEIMGNGQQVVCYGLHKETRQPYRWHGGEPGKVRREDLPYVRQADMEAFIDAAAELLVKEFGFVLIENRAAQANRNDKQQTKTEGVAGVRERAYAEAALEGCATELAATKKNSRNDKLNALAFRLGRMVARGWIKRADIETALLEAMQANGGVADDGLAAAAATLKSGLDAGLQEPHLDLPDEPPTAPKPEPLQHPPRTLIEVHDVFRKWFGAEYDTATIDAVMATAAAERLSGDPLWLLLVSGPGNTKTETVQSLAGAGAHVTSTIASEGALLSASPRKSRIKTATGGLLRKIGDRGVLVIKDVTSILSSDRNVRAGMLAALREVYDGRWERNVGTDGGQTLTWIGRIAVVGAVTTAWDVAHSVVSVMGDRFVLIRSDSTVGRRKAGAQAIRNTGGEAAMRAEISSAVGGLIGSIDPDQNWQLTDNEIDRLIAVSDIVTYARTAVEHDYRGDVVNAHAPEMPTRFSKQLAQMVRGSLALGMNREAAMLLALRCARDSMPQLRLEILIEIATNPRSRVVDVSRNISKPYRTVRRELEALHILKLLRCDEEQSGVDEDKTVWRYSLAEDFDRATLLTMGRLRPFNLGAEK